MVQASVGLSVGSVADSLAFNATLERPEGKGTWTYFSVPVDIAARWGTRAMVRVKGTVNGVEVRRSLMPNGRGGHYMPLNREILDAAHAGVGDAVVVVIERDVTPRKVAIPLELARALVADGAAQEVFEKMAPSHRAQFAKYVAEAKREDTRDRRAKKCVDAMRRGPPWHI